METAIPKLSLVESLHLNNREEPAEVAQASVPDASWMPSWKGLPGTSHWEETLGKT